MRAAHAVRAVQGVDRLVPLLFNIQNENESPFQEANAAAAGVAEGRPDFRAEEFEESNLMHSINGWVPNPLAPLEGGGSVNTCGAHAYWQPAARPAE